MIKHYTSKYGKKNNQQLKWGGGGEFWYNNGTVWSDMTGSNWSTLSERKFVYSFQILPFTKK